MFYDKLFFTINLNLVNYLTCQKKHRIVKVRRDYRPESIVVYFYFEATQELLDDVDEYKSQYPGNNEYISKMAIREEGVFSPQY